jgi:2-C-methyl-D-erythritol 4-phosphate cytidylyltransferase
VSFPFHGVIITAAGSSERFLQSDSFSTKKEYVLLDNRSVLYHATLPFTLLPNCKLIVVTYPKEMRDETEVALDNLMYAIDVPIVLVEGGSTRQQSVYNGLLEMQHTSHNLEYVMIHDGARPWISEETIISTFALATVYGGAAPALSLFDALKKVNHEGIITEHIDRSGMVMVQTPQIFRYPEIVQAHEQALLSEKHYVDDTEIFTDAGHTVAMSEGDKKNIKITITQDLLDKGDTQ